MLGRAADRDELVRRVDRLDLSPVMESIRRKQGWLEQHLELMSRQYRQFLFLHGRHPNEILVPWSQELDDVWHEHILHSRKYAADCEHLFGSFFHHDPALATNRPRLQAALLRTRELYLREFVLPYQASREPGGGIQGWLRRKPPDEVPTRRSVADSAPFIAADTAPGWVYATGFPVGEPPESATDVDAKPAGDGVTGCAGDEDASGPGLDAGTGLDADAGCGGSSCGGSGCGGSGCGSGSG